VVGREVVLLVILWGFGHLLLYPNLRMANVLDVDMGEL
jgi:hypothetical protein